MFVSCIERVTLNLLLSVSWAFVKLVCAFVYWTRVGQWVTVAGCGSELWAFACFCVSWGGRGVSHSTPWGRRRIGQTRWKSVCISRNHWPFVVGIRTGYTWLNHYIKNYNRYKSNVTSIQVFSFTPENISMEQQWFHPMASLSVSSL